MELEEALALIETQKGQLADLKATNDKAVSDLTATHEKALQVSYNKGFDKAKNASEKDINDGYIKKEDVDKMLNDREKGFNTEKALLKMGVKNPKRALKAIEEDDLATIGEEGFNEEDFKKKYGDDIVFTTSSKEEDLDPLNKDSKNITKNNEKPNEGLTAEKYADMSKADRDKVSTADKLALL